MSRDCSKVTAVVGSAEETRGGPWAAYPCHVLRIVITADYGRTPRGMLLWGSLNASPVNCKGASPPKPLHHPPKVDNMLDKDKDNIAKRYILSRHTAYTIINSASLGQAPW